MNHGKCRNCWWYLPVRGRGYEMRESGLTEFSGSGICFMHSTRYDPEIIKGDSYCPDYVNRKTERDDLKEWIKETFKPEFKLNAQCDEN